MIRLKGRLSSSPNAFQRLLKGDFTQRFGRFLWFRQMYSTIQNLRQRLDGSLQKSAIDLAIPSMFGNLSTDSFVREVEDRSIAFGLHLPESIVNECLQYATQTICTEPGYDRTFLISDLDERGYLPDGHQPIRALVSDVEKCSSISNLSRDSVLLKIARNYLRYLPTQITCHLTWSLAWNRSDDRLQKLYPPTNFHYDIAGYNFVTAYFYITPVLDDRSGPHVTILGSHKRKPMEILLKSGRQTDEAIYRYYDRSSELYVYGDAGFGFFEDPSCIHKVKAPTRCHRLLLQFRFS
ncbi:MAG: hypothetical protein J7641_05225 [Cyanobacteria bacterium SID2]|nr:hypothetical protein [Cyanobacteria bacterium SID2]MBP0006266.1 hypothetical protein [Cyanobacteria bacterium SBC]